jgi:hypothetical protein
MKTPMQELIEIIKKRQEDDEAMPFMYNDKIIALAESMLEKERERLCDAYIKGGDAQYQYIIEGSFPYNTAEDWYNETFETKER